MKKIFTFLMFFTSMYLFSQKMFQEGKIEFENGMTVECLIIDGDWESNPESIIYKDSTSSSSEKVALLNTIKSFEIYKSSKYQKETIDFDATPNDVSKLSTSRMPEFVKKEVLLKVILEGKASLYRYEFKDIIRYYYKVDDNEIKPLIYKEFLNANSNIISTNNDFIYQLNTEVRCDGEMLNSNKIRYHQKDLKKYFEKYNKCNNSNSVVYEFPKKAIFNVNVFGAYSFVNSDLKIEKYTDFDGYYNTSGSSNGNAFRFGGQVELFLPISNYSYSLFSEFSYYKYNVEFSEEYTNLTLNSTGEYSKIDMLLGVRRFIYFNTDVAFYLEGSFNLFSTKVGENEFKSKMISDFSYFSGREKSSEISYPGYFSFGLGVNYLKKISVSVRFTTNQNFLKIEAQNNSEISLNLAYKIFQTK